MAKFKEVNFNGEVEAIINPVKKNVKSKGTVLVMAGGTGGHVFPAIASAECLQAMGFDIRWLGTRIGIESSLVPKAGFTIEFVSVTGLRGKGIVKLIKAPLQLLGAFFQSIKIIRAANPVAVLGMGGFVTGPAGVAAKVLGKVLIIHEQNAVAGMTNRYLAKIANQTLQAFPGSLPQASDVVGNPVRETITRLDEPAVRFKSRSSSRRVVIIGGSLGALALNETIPTVLQKVSLDAPLEIIHQCGEAHIQKTQKVYAVLQSSTQVKMNVEVKPFIDDMAALYGWADLLICRAGALTVSEIAAAGVASILIPFPFAVDDHQTKNAEYLASAGAAEVIQQKDIDAGELADRLTELLKDREQLLKMAEAARNLAKPEAANSVANAVVSLVAQAVKGGGHVA